MAKSPAPAGPHKARDGAPAGQRLAAKILFLGGYRDPGSEAGMVKGRRCTDRRRPFA